MSFELSKLEPENSFLMESLNALFEHATEGIIISDKAGKIIRANPSAMKIFGYEMAEFSKLIIEDLIPSRFKTTHTAHRSDYNKNPHARAMGKNITLYALHKNGSEFPVEISLSYYRRENETYVICFVIDITERKKQEEDIRRMNQELEKKVNERTNVLREALIELERSKDQLSQALEKEKELNDMKSRFVTMASHEFRTPLSTILSSVSLINTYSGTDEKITRHVQRIKSAVTNMTLILNDFLSAEKLEQGKVLLNTSPCDLQQLANEVLGEITGILKSGQKVNYLHTGETTAMLDKQMVRNILLNLLSNAIKFSPENKTIQLSTTIAPTETSIVVADQGLGIPAEEKEHLFERFFRAKNVTNIQGTGLGLNIVSKYVEAMKGRIQVESELNVGTTFSIKIPNTD